MKDKGIIYYTNNILREESLFLAVQEQIKKSGLPIVSCSLKPINFGKNIVHNGKSGIISYFTQIHTALKNSTNKYVFFCEHDVFYHPSHFEFDPPSDDIFYYNTNVWRWYFYTDLISTNDNLMSVSGICANRELALNFYENRLKTIYARGYDKIRTRGNPLWARRMSYEPGKANGKTKKETRIEWKSKYPNIDVRHTRNITATKRGLTDFRRKPTGWQESSLDKLPGWDLKYLKSLRNDANKINK